MAPDDNSAAFHGTSPVSTYQQRLEAAEEREEDLRQELLEVLGRDPADTDETAMDRTLAGLENDPHHKLTIRQWATLACRQQPEEFADRGLPKQPTRAMPGAPEKENVLATRCSIQKRLHHPDDLRLVRQLTEKECLIPNAPAGNNRATEADALRDGPSVRFRCPRCNRTFWAVRDAARKQLERRCLKCGKLFILTLTPAPNGRAA